MRTNERGFDNLEAESVWQFFVVNNWIFASAGNDNIYISKIINGKVADWQKMECQGLEVLDEHGIVIDCIHYKNNKLIIGTSDYFNRYEWEGTHGRGIWYANFPLD